MPKALQLHSRAPYERKGRWKPGKQRLIKGVAAKWAELPAESDAVNLDFVRKAVGKVRVTMGAVVSRRWNSFPLVNGFRRCRCLNWDESGL